MFSHFAKRIILRYFSQLKAGCIHLTDENGKTFYFGSGNPHDAIAVYVYRTRFYKQLLLGGSVQAACGYQAKDWACPRLTDLLALVLENKRFFKKLDFLLSVKSWFKRPYYFFFKRNTVGKAKQQITAHYDLSNDFFKLFLDKEMLYSSALFTAEKQDLATAQQAKMRRICEQLALKPGDHVLEIGTGWGGFACFAAKHYDVMVTTTTISAQQFHYAKQKITAEKLDHRIQLLNQDYRALRGQYDKIISIEMIEAIGHQYFNRFFAQCQRLLKVNGRMLIQAILINEQHYDRAKYEEDFIRRFIFPGGCLPSLTCIMQCIQKKTYLRLIDLKDLGLDYYHTLQQWRHKFDRQQDAIKKLGLSESFIRLWRFYFCYCEAGFRSRYISNAQLLFDKPPVLN